MFAEEFIGFNAQNEFAVHFIAKEVLRISLE